MNIFTRYYKCALAKINFCGATAKKVASTEIGIIKPHNQEEQTSEENGINEFKNSLKRKASLQICPLNSIYEAEARR